jgi:hypothetical protein
VFCLHFFLSIIVFSVLLQFTDSDYPFGFFQLFLLLAKKILNMCISLNTAIKIMYYRVIAWILVIIMISVNFFCNISSYDILAYITNNYIALIYYAKIVHLLCQFHAGNVGFSAVFQAMYSWSMCKGADPICQSIIVVYYSCYCFLILVIVVNYISNFKNLYIFKALNETKNILTLSRLSDPIY